MTTTERTNIEIPRDRYGRPQVMTTGGKRVAYRRTTTFVGCLDDTYGLMQWKSRMVALGMGQRKDLVLAAAAASPDDKGTLNEIAEKATEAATASAAATTGTALHSLTERIDHGKPLGYVPDEYLADIAAYQNATQHIEWTGIESFRVHDDWKIAGTADRIGRFPGGRLAIFDIKTGSIDYPHKMAMQLAMYARMTPYDIPSDTRGADPEPVNLNTGYIIHLPAGQGRCDLYEIDLHKGWGACQLARQVWDWRGVKGLTHLVDDERVSVWEKANLPRPRIPGGAMTALDYLGEAQLATSVDTLRFIWKAAKEADQLTPSLREYLTKRSAELAA